MIMLLIIGVLIIRVCLGEHQTNSIDTTPNTLLSGIFRKPCHTKLPKLPALELKSEPVKVKAANKLPSEVQPSTAPDVPARKPCIKKLSSNPKLIQVIEPPLKVVQSNTPSTVTPAGTIRKPCIKKEQQKLESEPESYQAPTIPSTANVTNLSVRKPCIKKGNPLKIEQDIPQTSSELYQPLNIEPIKIVDNPIIYKIPETNDLNDHIRYAQSPYYIYDLVNGRNKTEPIRKYVYIEKFKFYGPKKIPRKPFSIIKLTKRIDPHSEPEKVQKPKLATNELVSEVRNYVKYAGASYCEPNFFGWYSCSYCREFDDNSTEIKLNDPLTKTHAIIVVVPNSKEVVVAYRGSDGLSKFLQAAITISEDYPYVEGAKVHSSYLKFINGIHPIILDKLIPIFESNPDFKLVLTGHSLGGGLATLAAPLLRKELNLPTKRIRVITYNQPRFGNLVFTTWFNYQRFNYTRVVNGKDHAVNHPSFSENWVHPHRELFINSTSQYYDCVTTKLEHPHCSFEKSQFLSLLTEHEYVGGLFLSPRGC